MADKQPSDVKTSGETPAATPTPATPPRRSPGHRGADVRDTVAEMAARAQEISQEAGSRMAAAMKDVIAAAAGMAGFAVESARDLVQYMVRRGQMTQEEADKLIREAEAAQVGRPQLPPRSKTPVATPAIESMARAATPVSVPVAVKPAPVTVLPTPAKSVPAVAAPKPAAKAAPPPKAPAKKAAAKAPAKPAAKKPPPKAGKSTGAKAKKAGKRH